jgi:subtilisin family serine protease
MISRPLAELMARTTARQRIGVVIELSGKHPEGVEGAGRDVETLLKRIAPKAPVRRSRSYVVTALLIGQIRKVVQEEQKRGDRPSDNAVPMVRAPRWAIHRIWPNFEVNALIHRSVVTTKCDAAQRSFDATGAELVWAVLDSGIHGQHAHFALHDNLARVSGDLPHRSFTSTSDDDALLDLAGHGTHVAGILAGEPIADGDSPIIAATWYHDDRGDSAVREIRLPRISGMAPRCKLLSCKVLRDDGSGDLAALLEALEYIQDPQPRRPRSQRPRCEPIGGISV